MLQVTIYFYDLLWAISNSKSGHIKLKSELLVNCKDTFNQGFVEHDKSGIIIINLYNYVDKMVFILSNYKL